MPLISNSELYILLRKSILDRLQKSRNYLKIVTIVLVIGIFIFHSQILAILATFIGIGVSIFQGNWLLAFIFALFFVIFIFTIGLPIWFLLFLWNAVRKQNRLLQYLERINFLSQDALLRQQNTDEILVLLEQISVISKEDILYVLAKNKYNPDRHIYLDQIEYLRRVIDDLHQDLLSNLEKQKSGLIQANATIQKHLTGTTELDQVAELQKARLDRQIEQFEELQKVLVKN